MNFKQNPGEGLINTDRFPKQVPKVQASSGVLGRASPGNGLDHIPGYAIRITKESRSKIIDIKTSMQTNNNQAFHEKHFYFKLALTLLINSVPLFKYFVYLICQSIYSIVPFYVEVMPIYHPDAHA